MLKDRYIGFLSTPPLWLNTQFNIEQFLFPIVKLSTFKPKPIPERLRLGHQMEHVCKQLLQFHPDYEILVHNLPVRDGKQTIGEIDFVLQDIRSQELIHIELTYKFYIINPEISEPIHCLMGPNRRDMFFTKMEKIKNTQFQLLHSSQGIEVLEKIGIDHAKIAHKACYKAQLFQPYKVNAFNIRPLNMDCLIGFWLRFEDFNSKEFNSYEYYIPFKSEWVVKPNGNVKWLSHYATLLEVNLRMIRENAPMIWMRKSETHYEKFFVVWW